MEFKVNSTRFDPYKNFKFRIIFDGKPVAGVCKISALKRTTELVTHGCGNDPSTSRISPGRSKYEPITCERGVSHDPAFQEWANKVHNTGGDGNMSLKDFRKDVIIELLNLQGNVAKAYKLSRCWVSEYQALPELDANANAVAIEMIVIQCEGIAQDLDVTEPVET